MSEGDGGGAGGGRPRLGYSAAQVRAAERPLIERGEPLMQLAAAALAEQIARIVGPCSAVDGDGRTDGRAGGAGNPDGEAAGGGRAGRGAVDRGGPGRARGGPVLLLVGSGDNGGDALFAGARLAALGFEVVATMLGSRVHAEALRAATAAGVGLFDVHRLPEIASRAVVVVDGILGIGGAGPLRGDARAAVVTLLPLLRGGRTPAVIAVDLPSGIDPDTGAVPDDAVLPADVTVTFGAYKAGLLLPPATGLIGRLVLVDIGLRPALATVSPLVRLPASD